MLKMLTGFTHNIDDFQLARQDLREQIQLSENRLANTIGLFSCHSVAFTEGIISELQHSYPFPTVGISTIYSGTDKGREGFGLSAVVLTSDDLTFGVETIDLSNDDGARGRVENAVAKLFREARPAALFLVGESSHELSGEILVQYIDEATGGGIPQFGMFAASSSSDAQATDSAMYYNGEALKNLIALIAVYGDFNVDFHNISTADTLTHSLSGRVTKSSGNLIEEINNMPALEFFASKHLELALLITAPFIVTYPDGFTVTRCMMPFSSAENGVIFFGAIPEGSRLVFGIPHREDVYKSARQLVAKLKKENVSGVIISSCIYRSWLVAGYEDTEEEIFREVFGEANIPYWFMYSFGELSPTTYDGKEENFFHNYSLTVMTF
ncbi:MAG: FIST C-terminal domain-containing protein [Oscillospiraceae bacterium]|jgi:hypothetical protein|nr:FIST C-terminal domain-containing protein [Oscillospiraceae bacterium]